MKALFTLVMMLGMMNVSSAEQVETNWEKAQENPRISLTRQDLAGLRRDLREMDIESALRKVNRWLSSMGDDGRRFHRLGLVFHRTNSQFRCDGNQQQRAVRVAANAAQDDCYRAGYSACRVVNRAILSNGYLGSVNGTYYGYGCKASVVVQGQH